MTAVTQKEVRMKVQFLLALASLALAGCTTPKGLSVEGDKVQIQPANSTLVASCKSLGPISIEDRALNLLVTDNQVSAYNQARNLAAQRGADTFVVTSSGMSRFGDKFTLQGVAMRCY